MQYKPQSKRTLVTSKVSKTVLKNKRFGDLVLISPLNFPSCSKGRERKKHKRQGAPALRKEREQKMTQVLPFLLFLSSSILSYMRSQPKNVAIPQDKKIEFKLPMWQSPVEPTLNLRLKLLSMILVIYATSVSFH